MTPSSTVEPKPAEKNIYIRFACGLYDRMLPLFKGDVRPEGIDLEFIVNDVPREIFDRMGGKFGFLYDASELSSSEYISRFDAGECPFVALPVFPSRVFRHGFIVVNRRSNIQSPKDLEGKRIGVPLYTMTAAIWMRALLAHEYGVDLTKIQWVQGALNSAGQHGNARPMPLIREVPIEFNASGKSLGALLAEGRIDAVMGSNLIDGLKTNPDIVRLFPNYREVEKAYYRRTDIFPIMHLVVIRKEIHDAHPFVAQSLYDAFCRSKTRALELMRVLGSLRYMLPWMTADLDEIDDLFGPDPWPYGIERNRPTLEALIRYMAEQGFIRAPIPIEKLFVKVAE